MDTAANAIRHEVVIDRKIADLHGQLAKLDARLDTIEKDIRYGAGQRIVRIGQGKGWSGTLEEALAAGPARAGNAHGWDALLAKRADALRDRSNLVEAIREAGEAYTGWTRFFLVTSSDGHVHRSMSCSTCYHSTTFAWLPDLSGLDEAAAVAAHGAILCSVCFPSAPVAWTNGHETAAAERKAAQCPGSGQYVERDARRPKRAQCPSCGTWTARTAHGLVRAHKPSA